MRLTLALIFVSCSASTPLLEDADETMERLGRDADRARGFERFGDAGAAASAVISRVDPLVVGFGEHHVTHETAPVASSLTRFGEQILPVIAAGSISLVVESYVQESGCGQAATAAAAHVENTMQRPSETENHIMRVLRLSKAAGVQGYILDAMSCADLEDLRATGEVDYAKLLGLITRRLGDRIEEVLAKTNGARRVLVYGGSLHNEAVPQKSFADFSYAERVSRLSGGRYLEIDFLVPELIRDDEFLPKQPWFATAMEEANPDTVLVFRRAANSYVIVAKTGVKSQ
jgi:hypothetical protein